MPANDAISRLDIGVIIDKATQSDGLDASVLLDDIAKGQGYAQSQTPGPIAGDIGSDLANQITGGGSTSLDQILSSLQGQGQNSAKSPSAAQEQGQGSLQEQGMAMNQSAHGQNQGNGPDRTNTQAGNGGNVQVIQIKETIIQEANGQQIQTEVIEAVEQQSAAVGPVTTPLQAPQAEAQPTPLPAAAVESLSRAKPSTPMAELPAEAKSSSAVMEAAKPTPGAQTPESMIVAVRPDLSILNVYHFLTQCTVRRRGC